MPIRYRTTAASEEASNRAMSQPRVISSALTPLVRVGLPLLTALTFVLGFVVGARRQPTHFSFLHYAAAVFLVALVTYWCVDYKRVALTDTDLRISDFRRRRMVVRLRDVDRVIQEAHAVAIHFTRDTDFGRRVRFMPRRRFLALSWTHPIVHELRAAAAAAKRNQS
jgi:hypothetical protein